MSSGKLSIINGILGEKVLFIGILVIIIRVCRIRNFEELVILVWDKNDKEDLEWI